MNAAYLFAKIFKKLHSRAVINSIVHKTSKVEAGSEIVNTTFGKHSFCGYYCEIANCDIGSYCSIANHVVIGGGMHPMSWISTSPVFYKGRDSVREKLSEHDREPPRRVTIGHDVWIGERAMVKQGVVIGTGAIVGMGSVVTRDVPPYAIVAGSPARLIRMRFEPALVEQLLGSHWWDRDEAELRAAGPYAKDPARFLQEITR